MELSNIQNTPNLLGQINVYPRDKLQNSTSEKNSYQTSSQSDP